MVPIQWCLKQFVVKFAHFVLSLDFASYGELQMQLANQAS